MEPDYTRLQEGLEAWCNLISYIAGILLMLCGLYNAPKKWILCLGIIFLISGNSVIKMYKVITLLFAIKTEISSWLYVKLHRHHGLNE